MAIRYDRDRLRPTNGPMIFFTDLCARTVLTEEISRAAESRLSFYAYRRPGDLMVSFGTSEGFVRGLGVPGFVISPFNEPESTITIPWKPTGNSERQSGRLHPFPDNSTTEEQHHKEVTEIIEALQGDSGSKTVAATVTCLDLNINPGATFSELCTEYPECFVFIFATPLTGCWIGASPELLLETDAKGMATVSLAGTRLSDSSEGWDIKNIEEQAAVTRFIIDALRQNGFSPHQGETMTKSTGKLEHISTSITTDELPASTDDLLKLLTSLSPTPAICGMPRQKSIEIIQHCENFNRDCYGGFCGPFRSHSDFSFYVTLRCAQFINNRIAVYAGGGITHLSDAEKEWMETRRKANAIISKLITKSNF